MKTLPLSARRGVGVRHLLSFLQILLPPTFASSIPKKMKNGLIKFFLASLLFIISFAATSQTKVTDLPTLTSDPSGGWILINKDGLSRKIDAANLGVKKLDSIFLRNDTLFSVKNGSIVSFNLLPHFDPALLIGQVNQIVSDSNNAVKSWVNSQNYLKTYTEIDPLSVHIADSINMLLPYLRKADTAGKWAVVGSAWNISGNNGTNYLNNWIGTNDNNSFRIRTNNQERVIFDSLGNIYLGGSAGYHPFSFATNGNFNAVGAIAANGALTAVGNGDFRSTLSINNNNSYVPNPSAQVDINSTNAGILIPRLPGSTFINKVIKTVTVTAGGTGYSPGTYITDASGSFMAAAIISNGQITGSTIVYKARATPIVPALIFRGAGNTSPTGTGASATATIDYETGVIFYNTTTSTIDYYTGANWLKISTASGNANYVASVNGNLPDPTTHDVHIDLPAASSGGISNISGTANRVSVVNGASSPVIDISNNYLGQASITTVGSVVTGQWQASPILDNFIASSGKWNDHLNNFANPHGVTIGQLGYGNINNTSDLNKPIPTTVQNALNSKVGTGILSGNSVDLNTFLSGTQVGAVYRVDPAPANNPVGTIQGSPASFFLLQHGDSQRGFQMTMAESEVNNDLYYRIGYNGWSGNRKIWTNYNLRSDLQNDARYSLAITPGTPGQYWRWDKTWQTLNKAAVGLPNVDDTPDSSKIISNATKLALNGKINTNATVAGNPLVNNNFEVNTSGIVHDGQDGILKASGLNIVTAIGDDDYATPGGVDAAITAALSRQANLSIKQALTGIRISTFLDSVTIREKTLFGGGNITISNTDSTITFNVPTQAAAQQFDTTTIYQQLALKANLSGGNQFTGRQGFGIAPSTSYQMNILSGSGDVLKLATTSPSGGFIKMESPLPTAADGKLLEIGSSAAGQSTTGIFGLYSDGAFSANTSSPTGFRVQTTQSNSNTRAETFRIGANGSYSNTGAPAPAGVMIDYSNSGKGSTAKGGLLPPRMTQDERLGIASPKLGLLVDQIDGPTNLQGLWQFANSNDPGWVHFRTANDPGTGGSSGFTLQGGLTTLNPTVNGSYYIGAIPGLITGTPGANVIPIPNSGTLVSIQFFSTVITGSTGSAEAYTFRTRINGVETIIGTGALNNTRETKYLFDNLNQAVIKDQTLELRITVPGSVTTLPTQSRITYVAYFQ